jgi:hypothetical protein
MIYYLITMNWKEMVSTGRIERPTVRRANYIPTAGTASPEIALPHSLEQTMNVN